jgi:hypothetical protein
LKPINYKRTQLCTGVYTLLVHQDTPGSRRK